MCPGSEQMKAKATSEIVISGVQDLHGICAFANEINQ